MVAYSHAAGWRLPTPGHNPLPLILERGSRAELIIRFARLIGSQFSLPQIHKAVVEAVRLFCGAEKVRLFVVDPHTGELNTEGSTEPFVGLQAGQGLVGRAALAAEPLLVQDVEALGAVQDPAWPAGHRGSIIAVPLTAEGDVVGVLTLLRGDAQRPFDATQLSLTEELAPFVAYALHNAKLNADLRRAQTELLSVNAGLERKVQERTAQISRAKQEWEKTFDAIAAPIALQQDFVVVRANQAYARLANLPIAQAIGRTCHQLLAGRDSPCPGCPLLAARGGPVELTFGRSSFRASAYRFSDDPQDRTWVVQYQDVTEEKALQGKLRESERLASLGQLASGAAHEINNPLGFLTSNLRSLQGSLEELQGLLPADSDGSLTLQDGVDIIQESLEGARRVADIVRGLRELARQEIDRVEPCDVNASVSRVAPALFHDAPHRAPSLCLGAAQRAAIAPLQLDQLLEHLFRNARQAVTGPQSIYVRTYDLDDQVAIEVRDEGIGIAPEHLRRVFEPFFTTRGIGRGVGLGLTAAYGIVQRAGGTIELDSEVGKGTRVTVLLPKAPAHTA